MSIVFYVACPESAQTAQQRRIRTAEARFLEGLADGYRLRTHDKIKVLSEKKEKFVTGTIVSNRGFQFEVRSIHVFYSVCCATLQHLLCFPTCSSIYTFFLPCHAPDDKSSKTSRDLRASGSLRAVGISPSRVLPICILCQILPIWQGLIDPDITSFS